MPRAKACAAAVANLISGAAPPTPKLLGACYNTVAPGYAFSQSGIYQPKDGIFVEIEAAAPAPSMRRARSACVKPTMRSPGTRRSRWMPLASLGIQIIGAWLAAAAAVAALPCAASASSCELMLWSEMPFPSR